MVRRILCVRRSGSGCWWYVLRCSHMVIALDYNRSKGVKALAFCPTCWSVERESPCERVQEEG